MNTFNPVAKTSLLVAAARAIESKLSQTEGRLFHDPYAELLAGSEGMNFYEEAKKIVGDQPALAFRTRFIDDKVLAAQKLGIKQIVILAAGMDSRAFRLGLDSETILFEIDQPEVLEYKNKKLEGAVSSCKRICIGADLLKDWEHALLQNGFDRNQRTLWITEGLYMYLESEAVQEILNKIKTNSILGSLIVCDIMGESLLKAPFMATQLEFLKKMGAPWKFGTDHPEALFEKINCRIEVTSPFEIAPERWPAPKPPPSVKNPPRSFFIQAIFQK